MSFDRSQFMRERWGRAEQNQKFYEELTGETKSKREFFKTEDPLSSNIVMYEVSFQLDYSSPKSSLSIYGANTFRVYAFKPNNMTEDIIIQNTEDAVKDSKGINTNNGFSVPTQDKAISELKVNLSKFRGMEREINPNITNQVISNIRAGKGLYVEQNDADFTVQNRAGTKAKMRANLKNYFSN